MGIWSDGKYIASCSLSAAVGVALIGTPTPASADSVRLVSNATSVSATQLAPTPRVGGEDDPANWTNARLAARMMLVGASSKQLSKVKSVVAAGAAGIVLFDSPPKNLGKQLAGLRATAPDNRLIVSSDEEGGKVQRLAKLIGKMPSAKSIGKTKTVAQTRALAFKFGKKMKTLGVGADLAPVADLAYAGSWTDRDGRAFKRNPTLNGAYVTAFAAGLADAGVMATVKHWPGGGKVTDTHVAGGKTPTWTSLQKSDLVPFRTAFAAGVGAVMVSHAKVPGLSKGLPASQSKSALAQLRGQAGGRTLIMTDSLMMAAVTSVMGQSQTQAAVRAIANGADLALIQGDTSKVLRGITRALDSGRIPREQAIASVRRVVAAQQSWG